MAQTRSRLAAVMPESASRVVSVHDVDAHPIRKGRLGKPVEFVYKAQIVDNADGVILDYNAEVGNPADAPQLVPAIARITTRTGHTGINGARHPTHRHFDGERPFSGRSS